MLKYNINSHGFECLIIFVSELFDLVECLIIFVSELFDLVVQRESF